jgi:quaternary ammonium compound-resistance protein SugE
MALALLLAASTSYAAGGLFMKRSAGLTVLPPTLAFLGLFMAGALLQARGMKDGELGVAYIFVLGVEAVLTAVISTLLLNESLSLSRVGAIAVIVAGIAWLHTT